MVVHPMLTNNLTQQPHVDVKYVKGETRDILHKKGLGLNLSNATNIDWNQPQRKVETKCYQCPPFLASRASPKEYYIIGGIEN